MKNIDKPLKKTILIIEDQPGFRRIFQDILEKDSYKVILAEDGEKGWQLAKSEKPKLILLDLILPKLHGFEVLKNIRAYEEISNVPIVILSVLGEKADIQKGLELGANDYIIKGQSSPYEIINKVHMLLEDIGFEKDIESYKFSEKEKKGRIVRLRQGDNSAESLYCPYCGEEIYFEEDSNSSQAGSGWFTSDSVYPNNIKKI
jgi:DNA-binding response OmpR family regulator